MSRPFLVFLGLLGAISVCLAQAPPENLPPPRMLKDGEGIQLASPPPEEDLRVLPINLPTALYLSGSRPIDVALAAERIRGAVAALELARATWLPSMTVGGDYNRHDGKIQDSAGTILDVSRSSMMFGAGSGIGSSAVFSFNEAIFGPLVARQSLGARQAELQAAANDSMVAVTDAYFAVQQARGELAGALDTTRRTEEVVRRVTKLAPGIVLPLEVTRAQAELARRQAVELTARERWQVASAELTRILRLDATAQVDPLEPPHLQVTLVDLNQRVDDLVVIGLRNRPELASNQAQVDATVSLLRQEKLRPLMPSVLLRGWSTPVAGTLGGGIFAGGTNGTIGNTGGRGDLDLQVLWQLDNLGFGNLAKVRRRESDYRAATLELFRIQDRVAAEVAKAYAEARQASRRAEIAEREVKLSLDSFEKNLSGLGTTRRVGELVQTVVRPQEVQAAILALVQAYFGYYQSVADSNRAQFRLYRAMGQPAQSLGDGSASQPGSRPCAELLPPSASIPGNSLNR